MGVGVERVLPRIPVAVEKHSGSCFTLGLSLLDISMLTGLQILACTMIMLNIVEAYLHRILYADIKIHSNFGVYEVGISRQV